MADIAESSSTPLKNKPVIVRVKRKAFHSRLDAFCEFLMLALLHLSVYFYLVGIFEVFSRLIQSFCVAGLEINERPLKRPLLDFEKLSISDSSTKSVLCCFLSLPIALFSANFFILCFLN